MAATRIDDKIRRSDALSKARGEAKYVSDLFFDGMLYAMMLRSTEARADIISITPPTLPDGYYFITADDIPPEGKNGLHMIAEDWRCFAKGDVRFVGETIGLFVGPSRAVLKSLVDNTKVEYSVKEGAYSIDDAIAVKGGPIVEGKEDDVMCQLYCEKGRDMESVFKEADEILTETFETGFQEHVHLETNGAVVMEEGENYVFYISCQCPFYVRKSVAGLLGIPVERVIVRQTTTGGAFGGKEHFPDVLAGPLLVAEHKIHKPIKLIFDREEDMEFSVKRHPSKIIYKSARSKTVSLSEPKVTSITTAEHTSPHRS